MHIKAEEKILFPIHNFKHLNLNNVGMVTKFSTDDKIIQGRKEVTQQHTVINYAG